MHHTLLALLVSVQTRHEKSTFVVVKGPGRSYAVLEPIHLPLRTAASDRHTAPGSPRRLQVSLQTTESFIRSAPATLGSPCVILELRPGAVELKFTPYPASERVRATLQRRRTWPPGSWTTEMDRSAFPIRAARRTAEADSKSRGEQGLGPGKRRR